MTYLQYLNLIDTQARMSLKADASKYYLGYIWWILEPFLFVAVFYLVFAAILNSPRADFLIFLICGKLPFVWFSKSVSHAANSIIANKPLISRVDIPKPLFPLAVVQEGMYKQAAVFVLLFLILLMAGYELSSTWFWLFPIILVNYFLITSCALLGSFIVCYVRDFSVLISLAMTFLIFTSGIFWDVRELSPELAKAVLTLNPIAFLLDAYRQVLMYDSTPDTNWLIILGITSLVITLAALVCMNKLSRNIALKALTA